MFRITLIGLVTLALAMGVGRFAFTPMLPMMREDGMVDIEGGGILASIHFLGYWLGAVSVTRVPCAPKTLLRTSLIVIGLGTVAMGMTDMFSVWLVLRWLVGVCSAWTLMLIGNYYIRHLADNGHATGQGRVFSGVGAGITLSGLACLWFMVNGIGSAQSWQLMGGVSLVLTAVVCSSMGAEIPRERVSTLARNARRSPLDWRIVSAYGAMGIGYIVPATYLPLMAREIVSSPLIFGWTWPIFGAAAFLSTLIAVRFHQRYSNRQIWAVCQVVMAAGLLLPVMYSHILTIIGAGLCVGSTFMVITMTGLQEAHRIAPKEEVMRHIAVMTAVFATGQMLGPVFASSLYRLTGSFSLTLVITSTLLFVTAMTLSGRSATPTG